MLVKTVVGASVLGIDECAREPRNRALSKTHIQKKKQRNIKKKRPFFPIGKKSKDHHLSRPFDFCQTQEKGL